MNYKEIRKDLFSMDDKYYLGHCISMDLALGAGIAADFEQRFNLRRKLFSVPPEERFCPDTVLTGKVFNLITKEDYYGKPTYYTMEVALKRMRKKVKDKKIKHLALPRIGSRMDKLDWKKVRDLIKTIFADVDVEIVVCYQ